MNQENQYGGGTPQYVNKCAGDDAIKNRPTNRTIVRETQKVCDLLHESVGYVGQSKEKFNKETELFHHRKCLFKRTEENYQRYRNLDMFLSTNLTQFNETVKTNVGVYSKGFKDLNETLLNVTKGIKELRTKVTDLKEAAGKLYNCKTDDCNKTQLRAITGKAPGCADQPPGCSDSSRILDELIYIPVGLMHDADILLKSAYDVLGIQTFSNTESLDGLQKKLDEHSKKITKQITEVVKAREADVKKLQEDMVKSSQEVEKAYLDLNHTRTNFEGYRDATSFLCKPCCACGTNDQERDDYKKKRKPQSQEGIEKVLMRPILELCHKDICNICQVVDNTFCCEEKPNTNTPPKPTTSNDC